MDPSNLPRKKNPLATGRDGEISPDRHADDRFPKVWSERNPAATPPERALISLFDACCVLVEKTRPRSPGTDASPRSMLELFSLLSSHPGFLLDCLVISKSSASSPLRRQALAAACSSFGATLTMLQKKGDLRKEVLAAARCLPGAIEDIASYVTRTQAASAADLLREAQTLGVPTYCCFSGIQKTHVEKLRSAELPELVVEAVQLSRALHGLNFKCSFEEIVSSGLISAALKNDTSLSAAIGMYEALGKTITILSRGFLSPNDITEHLQTVVGESPPISSLEELATSALSVVSQRLAEARRDARLSAERAAEQKALKLAASQDQLEKEHMAALVRQQKQEQEAVQRKQEALRQFHGAFQTTPIFPESLAILGLLESGTSIPYSHRAAAQRLFGIIECLRAHLFDFRGDSPDSLGDTSVQALANLIFSPANIGLAAQTFDIEASKCLQVSVPTKSPAEPVVRSVSDLFHSSPACRKTIMTMLDQADGIVLLGTALLPPSRIAAYVKARNWESYGVDFNDANIRQPLADRLRHVIEESLLLKEARAALPAIEPTKGSSKPVMTIPEWIEEVINRSEFVYSLEDSQVLVALKEQPSTALYIPAKYLQDKALFQKDFKLKLDDLLSRVEIERMISNLKTSCGFEVERINGTNGLVVSLWHRAYEINAALTGIPKRWAATLEALKQRFLQHEKSWEILLSRAEQQHFSVDRTGAAVVLRHPLLGAHPLSSTPYISVRKFQEVAELIEKGLVAERKESEESSRIRRVLERRERTIREQVLPLNGEDILVLDANVFIQLAAKRVGGGTWLDLLEATAALSNVRIMVPAIVADFEVLSRIVPFNLQDTYPLKDGFTARVSDSDLAMKHFLDGASRIQIAFDASNSPVYIQGAPGQNRRICLVESPGDEAFYSRMHRILVEVGGSSHLFLERVRHEVFGRGAGDEAITRFVRHCPFVNRIMVITSDIRYSRYDMPRTTGLGAPVSTCSVGAYVAAECSLRSRELGVKLAAPSPVHFHDIADDVKHHLLRLGRDPVYLFAESRYGLSLPETLLKPWSIEEIIRSGLG